MEGSWPAECLIRVPWTSALQGGSIEDKVALNPWLISICVDEERQSSLARLSNHGTPLVSRNTPSSDPPHLVSLQQTVKKLRGGGVYEWSVKV